jgi:NMD protein affecting ribosome stability and mRNA decay
MGLVPNSTTDLTCVRCGVEGEHDLVVVGRLLHSTRCHACGHVVRHEQRDLMSAYLRDLEHRLVTKPQRMARRAVHEPVSFLLGLPGAVLRQPAKLVDEIRTVLRGR